MIRLLIMNWAVYIITNTINNKNYVGITCERTKTIFDRFKKHIETAYSGSKTTRHGRPFPIYAAILKYGAENFSVNYLETNLSLYEAQEKEIEYIEEYDTLANGRRSEGYNGNGYNLTKGGEEPDWDPDEYEHYYY